MAQTPFGMGLDCFADRVDHRTVAPVGTVGVMTNASRMDPEPSRRQDGLPQKGYGSKNAKVATSKVDVHGLPSKNQTVFGRQVVPTSRGPVNLPVEKSKPERGNFQPSTEVLAYIASPHADSRLLPLPDRYHP